ncbi:histidinol-phosphatase (PHP family) [Pilibacter termitis]|jgi:histidinol-phosphatase (PHP family)|uniref:Histidinol-phosphatase n=1 Tax=Pilibacter termitis TaxID=263852 RepID=A0A1T4PND0_9ENTE|nr:histidinol-phosphatase HisJ [Pilibacter termitis]SJZ92408.1 histidinol-phosphatase (PHP family) [Pilibacter termitis]
MKKWDGHTHTEYCPHGTIDDTERLVLRAIELGFEKYSITEHGPLPTSFFEVASGAQDAIDTAGIAWSDWEHYLKKMLRLKEKYKHDIEITVGVELDYLADFEEDTREFLAEYGVYLEESILSVHFLNGVGGLRAIDYSAEDYHEGILTYYGDFQSAQEEYLRMVQKSIQADLGKYKPKRIGHISLARKFFRSYTNENTDFSAKCHAYYQEIFNELRKKQLQIDFNMAGLFKENCLEMYPPVEILKQYGQGVKLVYGSDSHDLQDVGRGYEEFLSVVNLK